jgi:general secretion pathway protein H
VLTILGVAAGTAIAVFGRSVQTVSARGAAWDLAAALRVARATAIRDNADAVFLLDVRNRVFKAPGAAGALPEAVTVTLVGAANERVDKDTGGIRFYSDGSSSGGRITVETGARTFRIGVDWLTGRVSVAD